MTVIDEFILLDRPECLYRIVDDDLFLLMFLFHLETCFAGEYLVNRCMYEAFFSKLCSVSLLLTIFSSFLFLSLQLLLFFGHVRIHCSVGEREIIWKDPKQKS